jgi:mRNA interferase MazF
MIRRGDIVLVDFPFTSGGKSKVRPALVIQNDTDNSRLTKTILAMISGNLRRRAEPTHLLIDPATPEGRSSGLHGPSVVVCVNLYTVEQADILRTIGHAPAAVLTQINNCLKAALELT